MTGSEYQELAMRTRGIPEDQKEDMLRHAVFEMNSEAGEVAGLMQKVYQGKPLDRDHLIKELGDVLWGVAEACSAIGTTMDVVMETNIEKLRARFPDGFSVYNDSHRKAGDL